MNWKKSIKKEFKRYLKYPEKMLKAPKYPEYSVSTHNEPSEYETYSSFAGEIIERKEFKNDGPKKSEWNSIKYVRDHEQYIENREVMRIARSRSNYEQYEQYIENKVAMIRARSRR